MKIRNHPAEDFEQHEVMVNDNEKLRKWNWGAFLLAPVWATANKLEWWAVLCFIPGINIVVALYLGYNGNKLAFGKSNFKAVDDFMLVQEDWSLWGLRVLYLAVIVVAVTLLL